MIEETQYLDLFDRYVTHVSYWVKKERIYNRVTGKYEDPDTDLMANIERQLDVDDADEFRRNLISAVAGHAIDNPGEKVDYSATFPRYLMRLKESYFRDRRKQMVTLAKDVLVLLEDGAGLDTDRRARAQATLDALKQRFGYEDASVRIAIGELFRDRYAP